MSRRHLIRSATAAVLSAGAIALAQGIAVPPASTLLPGDIAWVDTATPGVQSALLAGQLLQPGLYILRVRMAKDAKLPPHTHPDTRHTTVLSGEMSFGFGDSFEPERMKVYPAGSMIVIPANLPHYAWARSGEVIVQDTGGGPTGTAAVKH